MGRPHQVQMTMWDVQEERGLGVPECLCLHVEVPGSSHLHMARDREGCRTEGKGPTLGGHCERPSDQMEGVAEAQGIYMASEVRRGVE